MGNFLTFIDIYAKVETAAESGDYVTCVQQIARMTRRLIDFISMDTASFDDETTSLSSTYNPYSHESLRPLMPIDVYS